MWRRSSLIECVSVLHGNRCLQSVEFFFLRWYVQPCLLKNPKYTFYTIKSSLKLAYHKFVNFNMKPARPWILAHLKIIWQLHAVHQKVSRFFGPRYIGDDFFLGPNLVSFNLVWYSWPLGFFCLISGSGNGWIHVFNGDRHSVQIFPSQQSTKSEGSRVPDYIQSSCRSFIGVIVPYEISKVNFHVETKILVSMSEEI
jgi:hypothetical protein